jgi:hypothetical protein
MLALPLHPFLIVGCIVLSIYMGNSQFALLHQIWLPLSLLLSFCTVLLVALALIMKNVKRAAIVSSTLLFVLFSFRHVLVLLSDQIGPVASCFVWLALFALAVTLVLRVKGDYNEPTRILNVVSLAVVSMSAVGVLVNETQRRLAWQEVIANQAPLEPIKSGGPGRTFPDIYYIILDGYSRPDVMLDEYKHDAGEFVSTLEREGFYVAGQSRCNYCMTAPSLASSFNMRHLTDLPARLGKGYRNYGPLVHILQENQLVAALRAAGYSYFHLGPGEFPDDCSFGAKYTNQTVWSADFVVEVTNASPLSLLPAVQDWLQAVKREQRLGVFADLNRLADWPGPKFVFAHLLVPHPPYLFRADGAPTKDKAPFYTKTAWLDRPAYVEQSSFLERRLIPAIRDILKRSPRPPVIVLQSDHGGSLVSDELINGAPNPEMLKGRMPILYAVFLPDRDYSKFYDSITPVNTFRVLCNQLFGCHYSLLPDQSYFSTFSDPFAFTLIPAPVRRQQQQEERLSPAQKQ